MFDCTNLHSQWDNIIDNFLRDIRIQEDNAILTAFARYGYSKDWLLENRDLIQVTIWRYPPMKSFSVDGEELFRIVQIMDSKDDNTKFEFNEYVEFVKER